jgi:antitoxin component of MazEF toxin-antitoxin module
MGYKVKIQRVERGATKSFYVNFPAAVAEAANLEKAEEMEWLIENKNTFILQRVKSVQLKAIKAGRLVADTAKAGGKKNKSQ